MFFYKETTKYFIDYIIYMMIFFIKGNKLS